MKYVFLNKDNYEGSIELKGTGRTVRFYTKKQIRRMYPNRNYIVAGEVGNRQGVRITAVDTGDGTSVNVYRKGSHNKLLEKCIGYIVIDDNIFLALIVSIFHVI